MALRLVDMENALVDKEKNDAWSAWLVMQLQKCMPDWRTKASLEEIEAANNAERIVIHNVDIVRMLKVKNLAQKWRMKSKKHSFERQARELEDEYKGDQLKLVQKLERLRIKSAEKIRQRILARKKSTEGKLATIAPVMERRNSVEGGDGGGGGGGGRNNNNQRLGSTQYLLPSVPSTQQKRRGSMYVHHLTNDATVSDKALKSFLDIITLLDRSPAVQMYAKSSALQAKLPGFRVRMGFGLHLGWGIEVSVGGGFGKLRCE